MAAGPKASVQLLHLSVSHEAGSYTMKPHATSKGGIPPLILDEKPTSLLYLASASFSPSSLPPSFVHITEMDSYFRRNIKCHLHLPTETLNNEILIRRSFVVTDNPICKNTEHQNQELCTDGILLHGNRPNV